MNSGAGNQPAFPCRVDINHEHVVETAYAPGMTLRDWFAGQAVALIAIHPNYKNELEHGYLDEAAFRVAHEAYAIADAMLTVRRLEPRQWMTPSEAAREAQR